MKNLLLRSLLFIGLSFITTIITSCSKDDDNTTNPGNQSNLINKPLAVNQAQDDGADITAQYQDYTFRFTKTATYNGIVSAANDLFNISGTWVMDENYSKIVIAFDTPVTEFTFFNKQWTITNGSTTIDLTATNGETDHVRFSIK